MYNGFEWYGRTLEVREVSYLSIVQPEHALIAGRIVTLAFRDQVPTVVACAVVCVVCGEQVSGAASGAVSVVPIQEPQERALVATSRTTSTPTTLVLTRRLVVACTPMVALDSALGTVPVTTLSPASKLWSATYVFGTICDFGLF